MNCVRGQLNHGTSLTLLNSQVDSAEITASKVGSANSPVPPRPFRFQHLLSKTAVAQTVRVAIVHAVLEQA